MNSWIGRRAGALALACSLGLLATRPAAAAEAPLLTIEHRVPVKSTAPSMPGQEVELYVREVVRADLPTQARPSPDRVVLFVHGAGTPAEVSFDVRFKDYSWMAYLAKAGFDVFAVDVTGYGRSTRPPPMAEVCNVQKASQPQVIPDAGPTPCPPKYDRPITTMSSDWADVGAAVDFVRKLRKVDKVSLVGWSQGGPRTAGYTAQNPAKVSRLVVLAPAYNRTMPAGAPAVLPTSTDGTMTIQSEADFKANWDRQVGCPDQYEPGAYAAVWSEMLASDPVGAKWAKGVRRAPQVASWGFNQAMAAKLTTPFLMISGAQDKQVPPERVRELYADLGSPQKVFVDLACSSHNAMWEKNHLLLFKASLDWLQGGQVDGVSNGTLKLGY